MTYTKAYALMDPWAQTFPWDCLIRPTTCISASHEHSPMVNDPCAVEGCGQPLRDREVCYAVVELPRGDAKHERWVCWRHVRPMKVHCAWRLPDAVAARPGRACAER